MNLFRLLRIYFLFVFCCCAVPAAATFSTACIRTYGISDGLPGLEVYDVFQDSKQRLWFGTDAGVCCYDGNVFRTYTQRDGLPDHTIFEIIEDRKGRIWFRSYNGLLSWFDGQKIVQPAINGALKKELNGCFVLSQVFDEGDTLWIGCRNDGSWLKIPPGETKIYKEIPAQKSLILVREFRTGCFAFTALLDSKLALPLLFQQLNGQLVVCEQAIRYSSNQLRAIRMSPQNVVIAVNKNRYTISGTQITVATDEKSTTFLEAISPLSYYAGYQPWGGMRLYGLIKGNSIALEEELAAYSISDRLRDHEGGIWMTTIGSGVLYVPFPDVQQVTAPQLAINDHLQTFTPMPGGGIAAFSAQMQSIVFGANGVLSLAPMRNSRIGYANASATNGKYLFVAAAPSSCIYNTETDTKQEIYEFISTGKKEVVGAIAVIAYDETSFCVVSASSLYRINCETGACTFLVRKLPERVHTVAKGRGDTLWLGGISRLWMLLPEQPPQDWSIRYPILAQHIDVVLADTINGFVWLISRGSGIYRLGGDGVKDFNTIYPQLPLNCHGLCSRGTTIWVTSADGIWELQEATTNHLRLRNYNSRNGLPARNIVQVYADGDRLWAMGDNLLFTFEPKEYPFNPIPPGILLQGVFCNGRPLPLTDSEKPEFTTTQNSFRFVLSGLCFKSLGKARFRIQIAGVDNAWREIDQAEIVYYNLLPGNYTFTAYALNNDGITSLQPVTFEFTILRPIWKRNWFIALVALLLLTSAVLVIRAILLRIRERERTQHRLAELEITALRAQMDPHFIFNSINSIYNFVLTGDRKSSAIYVARFAKLIRNVLEYAPLLQITLEKELETLRLYIEVERLRFVDGFTYEIKVDPELEINTIQVVPLLIQPFVENAIWHGLQHKKVPGSILISISRNGQHLYCEIDDNGVGRKQAAEYMADRLLSKRSVSGLLNQRRLELLNELYGIDFDIQYQDKVGSDNGEQTGTRVILKIPLFQLKNR